MSVSVSVYVYFAHVCSYVCLFESGLLVSSLFPLFHFPLEISVRYLTCHTLEHSLDIFVLDLHLRSRTQIPG